jgi:hypothetical protein
MCAVDYREILVAMRRWNLLYAPVAGLLWLATGACGATGGTVLEPTDAAAGADRPVTGGAGGGQGGSGGAAPSGGGGAGGQATTGGAPGTGGSPSGGAGGTGGTAGQGGSARRDAAAGSDGRDAARAGDAAAGGSRPLDGGELACDDMTSPGRLGVYYYSNSSATGSSIQMYFDVVNFTAYSARLSDVTVRYWFTDEDASLPNQLEQYYVPIPTTMKFLKVSPLREGADTVLEVSYTGAGDAGASFVETRGFNFAFHKASYAGTYDQRNDYSYDPTLKTTLGQNPKITAYIKGELAWGCEPPLLPPPEPGPEPAVDGGPSGPDAPAALPVDADRGEAGTTP